MSEKQRIVNIFLDEKSLVRRAAHVEHERKVFFAKPDYWILSDRLLGGGRHLAESLFHFQAAAAAEIEGGSRSVRTVTGGAGLTILTSSESKPEVRIVCGREQPLQGWVPAGWGHHRPSPAAIYAFEGELPLGVDTVLYPYPKDQAPALRVERLEVTENGHPVPAWLSSGLCLPIDARRDYYLAAHEHRALRSCGPLVSDAEIVLLRCDGDGEPAADRVADAGKTRIQGRDQFAQVPGRDREFGELAGEAAKRGREEDPGH